MKHARTILAVPLLLSLALPWAALAATHTGNYTPPVGQTTNTMVLSGGTASGQTHQALEQFTVPASVAPTSLTIYWAQSSAGTAGTWYLDLSTYPRPITLNPASDPPCSAPASSLGSWSGLMSDLPVFTAGTTMSGTSLDTSGLTLYPSLTYALVFHVSAAAGANRLQFTTSGYADGTNLFQEGGCTDPYWIPGNTSSGAPTCTDTSKTDWDAVFDFVGVGTDLTLNVRRNGPDVSFYGTCVEPSDLPAAWTLDSNLVSILTTDTTSSTGTNVLRTAECRSGYYDSGTGTLYLWDGSFEAVATQSGTPQSFTASATFTVEGSSYANPTALLTGCPFSLSDVLSSGAFTQALGCYLGTFAKNAVVIAPFSWYTQVEAAAQDASATTTYSIGVPVPSLGWGDYSSSGSFSMDAAPRTTVSTVSLYDSGTATGAADVAAQKFPILRSLAGMFLWLEAGLWLSGMVYLFIAAL